MSATRFRFVGEGIDVTGAVQGNGGLVPSLDRLLAQQRLMREGHKIGIYEPRPGHVCVYPNYSARDNGRREYVPLKRVTITVAYADNDRDHHDVFPGGRAGVEVRGDDS